MICVHCNTPVPDHSKFCLSCGSLVSDPDVQSAATAAVDASATIQMENLLREDTEGEFEIGELIGRGGMAAVYLATEIHLSRKVAIKVLPPELTFGHGIERFKREAKIAAALDHPNIIPIHRIASGGKVFWYAMKYLEGEGLDEMFREKERFTLDETVDILSQVADALDYAHEHDVIHRDIKPANIMVDHRGRVVVTDFGIAKPLTEGTLTASGSVVGTPYYMSPEQGAGRPVQGTSDQYSVAVVAYEMLGGTRPFDGDSAIDVVHKHVMVEPPRLEEHCPGLPQHAYAAVHKALSKKPEQRFRTVGEFLTGLQRAWDTADADATVTEMEPARAPPVDTAPTVVTATPVRQKKTTLHVGTLVVFVIALITGGAWWWWWRITPDTPPPAIGGAAVAAEPLGEASGVGAAPAEQQAAAGEQPDTQAATVTRPERRPAQAAPPVAPAPAPGRVTVTGLPDSGTVIVDDGDASTARDFTLAAGRHILVLGAPGFETVVDTLRIAQGDQIRMRYTGRPLPPQPVVPPEHDSTTQAVPQAEPPDPGPPGVLVVRIRGGWANIFVDDVFKRRAQFTLPDTLPPGEHRIRLERQGFFTVDTTVTLRPNERRMITIPLRRRGR
jgi:predicted Ser/Thr protein kinase